MKNIKIKNYFITGLVILLPLALTIAVVAFIFNLITDPFVGIFREIFQHFDLFTSGIGLLNAEQVQIYAGKIIAAFVLFSFTVLLGAVARWFFIHYLLRMWDFLLHRIPFVSSIYKTCQDVIQTIFSRDANSFKQVVIVPFPNANTYSIGFVTQEDFPLRRNDKQKFIGVFVPTTPNPTSGFLMAFREEDIIYVDMSIEEAFKSIISCGAITPAFKVVSREEAQQINPAANKTAST